jgi:hypothetical protein
MSDASLKADIADARWCVSHPSRPRHRRISVAKVIDGDCLRPANEVSTVQR